MKEAKRVRWPLQRVNCQFCGALLFEATPDSVAVVKIKCETCTKRRRRGGHGARGAVLVTLEIPVAWEKPFGVESPPSPPATKVS